jgi:hypothetical protein
MDGQSGEAALEELAQAQSSSDDQAPDAHPWENKEQQAIDAVKAHRTVGGNKPVPDAIASSEFEELGVFEGNDEGEFGWQARWVTDRSLYWVTYGVEEHGVLVGARWLVQLDDEGPRPDEYDDGVIPANTLAEYVEKPSERRSIQRYVQRTGHVLRVLTEHESEDGVQLASSLLIYFLGRGYVAENTEVLGWTIVPKQVESGGEAIYDAYFQWSEDEEPRVAHWQVNVKSGEIRPQNLLATQIIKGSESLDAADVIDIKPRQLDLDKSPRRERNPMVRALRYVLSDSRRIEAVGALLSAQARNEEISYEGWRIEPDGCTDCNVKYQYKQAGESRAVEWHVTSGGDIQPKGEIAVMADRALRLEAEVDASVAEGESSDE